MSKLNIGAATLNQTPFDWDSNLKNIKDAIEQARSQGIDILCLPELCISGYGCEDMFLSEWLPTKAMQCLEQVKAWCQDITVAIGLPYRWKGDLYNTACLIQDGRILGITAKQWLANDGVHYEPRWFRSWTAGIVEEANLHGENFPFGDVIYEVHGIKLAFEICEDAWRSTSRPAIRHHEKAVDLILNPSASHFAMGKSRLREELVCTSSSLYACTYVYANLLGNESGRMIYDGELFISHHGKMVQRNRRLSFRAVNLISAEIDFAGKNFRPQEINADPQDKNTEFVKAASLALFDYMRKSRSRGFVLSLSGGADSSSCAVLVAEMVRRGCEELGLQGFLEKAGYGLLYPELKLHEKEGCQDLYRKITASLLVCAYQGTKNSSEATLNSARLLAEDVGALFYHWLIDEEVDSYSSKIENALQRTLSWEQDDLTMQNIQARARSPIIWMLANERNALLLTTSNRSEGDVGYTTMDGDTSGGLAPIAGVDKEFILQWLPWAERQLGYKGLQPVNNLRPSAELRPGKEQTDEEDLMPYPVIVAIERTAIRERYSPVQVYRILRKQDLATDEQLKGFIAKFFRMWSRNQWKRERIAPAFHLDDFNVDPRSWCRFPILSGGFKDELDELEKITE